MPRAFDITAATEQVNLSGEGEGELPFTVSNALRVPVRARATVMVSGEAQREWVSVSGEPERDFSPDGTQQFTVKLQVPKGTKPGRYTFRLLVVNVANPDEQYAEGPTVAFFVAEAPEPVKRPFPWWIVALVGGVILIVGVVVAILIGSAGPGLGEACDMGVWVMVVVCGGVGGGVCGGAQGFKGCAENAQCITERCRDGQCEEAELGRNCGPRDSCPPRQKCTSLMGARTCLLAPGEACTGDGQCTSLYCKDDRCTRDDGQCENNDDCRPPTQCHTNNLCLLPNGEACTENGVCISGFCSGGKCQTAPSTCSPPCPRLSSCVNGRCVPILLLPRVNEQFILRERNR